MPLNSPLSFASLRKLISYNVNSWNDHRREKSTDYSAHDAVMSGFACMYFQEPSLLQFQTNLEKETHQNNLRTLFDVQNIPSNNTIKDVLDNQDSEQFNSIFQGIVQRLSRGKQLDKFNLFGSKKILSIDGTQYHSSHSVKCKCCLTKNKDNPDKPTLYQHFAIQGAIMHPDMKQIIPAMAESIKNVDGSKKQDCGTNAAKRYIKKLRQYYPKMQFILTADDIYSHQPMVEQALEYKYNFLFVAKPSSHKHMMRHIGSLGPLPGVVTTEGNQIIVYQWANQVPINGEKETAYVNYFSKITYETEYGRKVLKKTESWVTDMTVNKMRCCINDF